MRVWGYALAGAMMAAPMFAGAITVGPGASSGVGVAGVMPDEGVRFVIPFTIVSGFEAVLGVSVSGDATGALGEFASSLVAVEFGLSPDASADVSQNFAPTDFLIPASASASLGEVDLFFGETVNLIFEMPAGFAFLDETLQLTYAYAAELRPVSPVNPIPLPASALFLLGGLGCLHFLRRKARGLSPSRA